MEFLSKSRKSSFIAVRESTAWKLVYSILNYTSLPFWVIVNILGLPHFVRKRQIHDK